MVVRLAGKRRVTGGKAVAKAKRPKAQAATSKEVSLQLARRIPYQAGSQR